VSTALPATHGVMCLTPGACRLCCRSAPNQQHILSKYCSALHVRGCACASRQALHNQPVHICNKETQLTMGSGGSKQAAAWPQQTDRSAGASSNRRAAAAAVGRTVLGEVLTTLVAVGGLVWALKLTLSYMDPYREQRQEVTAVQSRRCLFWEARSSCCTIHLPTIKAVCHASCQTAA
jgi:hypothetical protein